jgi:hypothetical protein
VPILSPGRGPNATDRRRSSARERLISAALGALAAALLVVGALAVIQPRAPRRGCIDVTIASSLGGQPLAGCGARARALCAEAARGGYGSGVLAACARADLIASEPRR